MIQGTNIRERLDKQMITKFFLKFFVPNKSNMKLLSLIIITPIALLILAAAPAEGRIRRVQAFRHTIKNSRNPKSTNTDSIRKGATVQYGLFTEYSKDGHYYFEIPDSLYGREIMVITRLKKAPYGLSTEGEQYGGQKLNEQVWKFERHAEEVFIRVHDYSIKADSGQQLYTAVQNSNLDQILAGFPVKESGAKNKSVLIEVTDFFDGDINAIGVSNEIRSTYKITSLDATRSYIDTIFSFPGNIEVQTTKTYRSNDGPNDKSIGSITFELNSSFILLPKIPMKPRLADDRVGYISQEAIDYGKSHQQAEKVAYACRWRVEPKDEAAYERGELTEPIKPIIIYVDPATPKQWVPYIIKGINDWQPAFEAAGFKNAIIGKPAPTHDEDPRFSTEDARYSVIRYFASDIENAGGPSEVDPRSGEILETHIWWYHNQLKELHDWYFIQTAAANPQARSIDLTDEQMGELIRTTVEHEVGHTLGLPHNWAASYAYDVDSMRSKHFTDTHGTAASIMDYARFNYVAQPGDGVTQFMPRIGEYDLWSIKWGYTWFPGNRSSEEERKKLDVWTKMRAGSPIYFFGQDFTNYDPRTQSEDIGNDAFKAGKYGIANLRRILPNIEKWTFQPGKNERDVKDLYNQVIDQYHTYVNHALNYVGGMYVDFKAYDDTTDAYRFVEKSKQQQAMGFLNNEVFTTPAWLFDSHALAQTDNGVIVFKVKEIQVKVLDSLLNPSRLARMFDDEFKNGESAYTPEELLHVLTSDLFTFKQPDGFKSNLQRAYIAALRHLLTYDYPKLSSVARPSDADAGRTPIDVPLSDIRELVHAELVAIVQALSNAHNYMASYRDDLLQRVKEAEKF